MSAFVSHRLVILIFLTALLRKTLIGNSPTQIHRLYDVYFFFGFLQFGLLHGGAAGF